MPGIPQHATMPALPRDFGDPGEVRQWAEGLHAALTRQHLILAQTLNATLRVGLAAEKSTTPDIDETMFYETDTPALFVAADGAWVQVAP